MLVGVFRVRAIKHLPDWDVVPMLVGVFRAYRGAVHRQHRVVPMLVGVFRSCHLTERPPRTDVVPVLVGVFRLFLSGSTQLVLRCPHARGGVPHHIPVR